MNFIYNYPEISDIAEIMKIENAGFSTEEAATEKAMIERINCIKDTFIVARNENKEVIGYIVGPAFNHRYLSDELYEKMTPNKDSDNYLTVLSLAVHPQYRKFGIGTNLLTRFAQVAKEQNRKAITLTCLEDLVPYYEQNGYKNEGVSESTHANEVWFNMVYSISLVH